MGCARGGRVRWPRQLKAIVSLKIRLYFSSIGLRTQTPASSDPWPAAAVCVLLPEIACAPLFPRVQGGMRGFLHVSRPQFSGYAVLFVQTPVFWERFGLWRF